jgi:hypothetical protein
VGFAAHEMVREWCGTVKSDPYCVKSSIEKELNEIAIQRIQKNFRFLGGICG